MCVFWGTENMVDKNKEVEMTSRKRKKITKKKLISSTLEMTISIMFRMIVKQVDIRKNRNYLTSKFKPTIQKYHTLT